MSLSPLSEISTLAVVPPNPHTLITGLKEGLNQESKDEVSRFLGQAVAPSTLRTYERHWTEWTQFLKKQTEIKDPYMRNVPEAEKPGVISLFLYKRYQAGKRGKVASTVTAGIRSYYTRDQQPTAFLDSAIVSAARQACQLRPTELRARRDAGAQASGKLPVCESIIEDLRERLWQGKTWEAKDVEDRMAYLACAWGYDQSARISEYTRPEPKGSDHCIRTDDLTFYIQTTEGVVSRVGSQLARLLGTVQEGSDALKQVTECRVLAVSTKGKIVSKAKIIARRSALEGRFLDDLIMFLTRNRAAGTDELFSCRNTAGRKVAVSALTVRMEVKRACRERGLPEERFSSHSLRKAGITNMRAAGATEEDRRDRGGYALGSQVMNTVYDCDVRGLGPLAASGLTGAYRPSVEDLRRLLPTSRREE